MARLTHSDAEGPIEVKPQDKSVWVCACGLTQNKPFCDGSHKKTKQEEGGKLYVYGEGNSEVVEVKDA